MTFRTRFVGSAPDVSPLEEMIRLGWRWLPEHLVLHVRYGDEWYRVALPVEQVDAAVGACLPGVGWGIDTSFSSVGFLKKLSRAAKKAVRPIVPKAIRQATASLERTATAAVRQAAPLARSIATSKALTTALAAASFIPGAAAITVPALAAQQAAKQAIRAIDLGMGAQRAIARGLAVPGARDAVQRGQQAVQAVQRITTAAKHGDAQAAHFAAAFGRLLPR